MISGARVWVIRDGEDNRLVDEFVDNGVTGVGYPTVPDGRTVAHAEVAALLRADNRTVPERRAAMFEDFVRGLALGDVVVMPDTPRGEVVIGRVTGFYEYRADIPLDRYRHRRSVRWLGRHRIDDLPQAWRHLYKQRATLQEYAAPELIRHADRVEAGDLGRPVGDRRTGRSSRRAAPQARTAAQLERRCPGPCQTMRPVAQFRDQDLCPDCR